MLTKLLSISTAVVVIALIYLSFTFSTSQSRNQNFAYAVAPACSGGSQANGCSCSNSNQCASNNCSAGTCQAVVSTSTPTPTSAPTNTPTPTNTPNEDKIIWCHTEPNGNQQTLELPSAALQNAGHMDANGNPLQAGDHAGACGQEVSPTPTPTGTVTPTPGGGTGGPGDGLSDGRSSCPECTQAPKTTQSVLCLSTTSAGGNVYFSLVQLLSAMVIAGTGFKLFRKNA